MPPQTRFTRADLMGFPAGTELELPLLSADCCVGLVWPFEQGRCLNAAGTVMQLAHYDCPDCGRVWGHYFPLKESVPRSIVERVR